MEREFRRYRTVLAIAGSDSGGGAGIQADLKTVSALGCYGMSAITALTAQNTLGVTAIFPVPPEFAAAQIEAVLSDMGADAVKIGMLYSAELIEAVAGRLEAREVRRIVLDPVMVAQSGDPLLKEDAVEALRDRLLPLATVLTPNLPEAEVLLGRPVRDPQDMESAARELARYGSRAVLVKGGHGESNRSDDLLYLVQEDRFVLLEGQRIETKNNHGTGCTLSSAIAAFLALGEGVESSVRRAKEYIQTAIRHGSGYRIGLGSGPVHHFFSFWQ